MKNNNVKIAEKIIRGIITALDLTPTEFMVSVHNACVHGEVWEGGVNFGTKDEHLGAMFDGMDAAIAATKKMS